MFGVNEEFEDVDSCLEERGVGGSHVCRECLRDDRYVWPGRLRNVHDTPDELLKQLSPCGA